MNPELASCSPGSMTVAVAPVPQPFDRWRREWVPAYLEGSRDVIMRIAAELGDASDTPDEVGTVLKLKGRDPVAFWPIFSRLRQKKGSGMAERLRETLRGKLICATVRVGIFVWLAVAGASPVQAQAARALKVALLPIPDVLPFHLADARGYFKEAGVEVVAVPVASPLERDQLMQAGQLDGMLTEIATTANFNRGGTFLKIVAIARQPQPGFSLFRILAAPGSGISKPSDLAGVAIGVSKNTVIEYVTDRLLAQRGLKPEQVKKKSVPVIPERFQLLLQGQIKAATLPEPLANSAMASGAVAVIADADSPRYSVSVLAFTGGSLKENPRGVRAFLKAWDRAAADINASPEAYRPLLLERIRVPGNIRDSYPIPPFPRSRVPDSGQWDDVMDWMLDKGLLEKPVTYDSSVTTDFLP